MKRQIRKLAVNTFKRAGMEIKPFRKEDVIFGNEFNTLYQQCKPYTVTSRERMYSVFNAINYIISNNIPGDIVECGVWKGGSSMMAALSLLKNKVTDRKIFLYDTFQGMTEPTNLDTKISDHSMNVKKVWESGNKDQHNEWCYSGLEEVKKNMRQTEYPTENTIFVKGDILQTLPNDHHKQIALLRLDTDWYESTKHEMIHLFPKLVKNGVIIIDDYGAWAGAKKAIDEYFQDKPYQLLLNRIDYTGRSGIKTF